MSVFIKTDVDSSYNAFLKMNFLRRFFYNRCEKVSFSSRFFQEPTLKTFL